MTVSSAQTSATSQLAGLSDRAARQRLVAEGPNELPAAKARRFGVLLKEVLLEPMVSLLVGCGAIYLLLGDRQEASMLLGFLGIIVAITIYQERKTETALEALRNLSSPRALVIRGGVQKRVPGREVVRDDLLLLNEGDRVPADAEILSASNLLVDESLLTGESVAVPKVPAAKVFAGTVVVRGQATGRVIGIAMNTEIGRIGKLLDAGDPGTTQLQAETGRIVKVVAMIAVALCVLVAVVYGLTRNDWLNGFLSGLTLAMAILPNELPAVLMVFLALGAWRVSQKNVLTRRMPAIESLGAATVLCVDKTGTLTLNRMVVRRLYACADGGAECELGPGSGEALPEVFHSLVEFGVLASSPSPFDPMERAVHQAGAHFLGGTEHLHPDWLLAREYPLTPEMLAVSQVWHARKGEESREFVVGAKGAPEAIVDLCHMDAGRAAAVLETVAKFAQEGLRVLGVAKAGFGSAALPGIQHDYSFEFLGLLGLSDPVRPQVPDAIQECYGAGVRVIMITGDHAQTAGSIAKEVGLRNPQNIITGPELSVMSDAELSLRVKTVNCFARTVPQQKLRIVEALKKNGETVAMTGDGVNDAPALKAAQIGIAMGGRGTDVARESAALVLLDDDFSSIVDAIATGRRIFENLKGAMAYLLSVHIPIAGLSVVPVLLKLPLVLMPVHIAFLHLIIEPACSVVFEAEPPAADVMCRPPRPSGTPLFSKGLLVPSLVQGLGVLLIVTGVFLIARYLGQGEREARALTFTTLIFANLGLILVNRSWTRTVWEGMKTPNKALWWVVAGTLAFLGVVLYVPYFRELFRVSALHAMDLAICFGAGAASLLWFEGWKILQRRP